VLATCHICSLPALTLSVSDKSFLHVMLVMLVLSVLLVPRRMCA
jgi:hypothetical protein